jgi:hypothetical protein
VAIISGALGDVDPAFSGGRADSPMRALPEAPALSGIVGANASAGDARWNTLQRARGFNPASN